MEIENCFNCDKKIGRLEQAYVYKGNVVCEKCYRAFQPELSNDVESFKTPALGIDNSKKMTLEKIGTIVFVILMVLSAAIAASIGSMGWVLFCLLVFMAVICKPVRKAVGLLMIILGIFCCFSWLSLPIGIISIFIGGIFLFS